MVSHFRWGILGTGPVARKFVLGLRYAQSAKAVFVASRSIEKARDFAQNFGIPHAGTFEDAVNDDAVDAVYVATPPALHEEHALLSIHAAKPVLVEKPFAVNATQAIKIAETARSRAVFCMEAMWTRFLPLVQQFRQMVRDGAVGEPRSFTASFGIREAVDPSRSVFSPSLGGGALLDRGVYPISLASFLFGRPRSVFSHTLMGETGVDEDTAVLMNYENGPLCLINASLRTQCSNDLVLMGSAAKIHVHAPIYRPFRLTVTPIGERTGAVPSFSRKEFLKESHRFHDAFQRLSGIASPLINRRSSRRAIRYSGNGYHYQSDEVMRCVRSGQTESPHMPLADSIDVMTAVDDARATWSQDTQCDGGEV